jgi:hypothetical protein
MHYLNETNDSDSGREHESAVTSLHHEGWRELNINERKPGERKQR